MTSRRLSHHGHDHQIAPGVFGWLEMPRAGTAAPDCVLIAGWAFSSASPIVAIRVAGCGEPRTLRYGMRREDVLRAYPDEPNALDSGFTGYLELGGASKAAVTLEVRATLGDGRTLLLFRRFLPAASAPGPFAPIREAAREVMARPRLLLSRSAWRHAWNLLRPQAAAPATRPAQSADILSLTRLTTFLASGARLSVGGAGSPVVSVVLVLWNRAELTLACLMALTAQAGPDIEVVIVDNASTDETRELLARLSGPTIVRNDANVGFTVAANLGAAQARGEFLLFLNNDAELLPGAIAQLAATARRALSIGAVGGKLVFPDGRLQEAGAIVWADGSCDAYGRGGDPSAPEFNFERPVDFCSGALLLTRRELFAQLGGFDERYRPAYYEDADYCARLWTTGYSVVYQPRAAAIHREFGSAASAAAAMDMQRERRPVFAAQHRDWLSRQPPRDAGPLAGRSHPHSQPPAIWIDDAAPDPRRGAGFSRAAAIVRALSDLGYRVTVYATDEQAGGPPSDAWAAVEVVRGGPAGLRPFLSSRKGHAAAVIVSRPHNMQYVKAAIGSDLSAMGTPCVYDAEAIYALREIGRRRIAGPPITDEEAEASIAAEARLTRGCAAVLVVSERERRVFAAAGHVGTFVVGHAVEPQPTPNPFERRQTILFVGAFGSDSPNEDAALFFCRDVLPALRAAGCGAPVVVAGARIPDHARAFGDAGVSWHSDVADLTPLYNAARVFVAPTRYAAGIPLKVIEAAAFGVPVVGARLIADQLGWAPGSELLAFDTADECAAEVARLFADSDLWHRLRDTALARVGRDHNAGLLRASLQEALAAATVRRDRKAAGSRPGTIRGGPD